MLEVDARGKERGREVRQAISLTVSKQEKKGIKYGREKKVNKAKEES